MKSPVGNVYFYSMTKSAGLLLYRLNAGSIEIFLVHPGGPFWKNKDAGAWSIPKGEVIVDEDPLEAAKREFGEETGYTCKGNFIPLEPVKMKSGKVVYAWALEQDIDPALIRSNNFEIEWPPRSGNMQVFPEVDRAGWFGISEAKEKINTAQQRLIDQLVKIKQA